MLILYHVGTIVVHHVLPFAFGCFRPHLQHLPLDFQFSAQHERPSAPVASQRQRVSSATASGRCDASWCVLACSLPLLSPCAGSDGAPSALPLQLCRADAQVPADLPLILSLMPPLSGDCHPVHPAAMFPYSFYIHHLLVYPSYINSLAGCQFLAFFLSLLGGKFVRSQFPRPSAL